MRNCPEVIVEVRGRQAILVSRWKKASRQSGPTAGKRSGRLGVAQGQRWECW